MSIDQQWHKDGFTISTEKACLNLDVIHGFLSQAYWAKGMPRELVAKSIENTALCFGIYQGDPHKGRAAQIGFARVITDRTTFAYLADVFVLPEFRGRGLSKWLMRVITEHPDLTGLRRFLLLTQGAHGLYARFGFAPPKNFERFMEIAPGPAVYQGRTTTEDPE